MKLKSVLFFVLLLAALSFQACKCCKKPSASADTGSKSTPVILLGDNGKTYELKVGDKFDAMFNECVGCAEVWSISQIDESKIKTLESTYSGKSCTDCVGGSQDHTFHFEVKAAGKSSLTFRYFEKTVKVAIDAK